MMTSSRSDPPRRISRIPRRVSATSCSTGVPWIGKKRIRCSGGGIGTMRPMRSSSVCEVLSAVRRAELLSWLPFIVALSSFRRGIHKTKNRQSLRRWRFSEALVLSGAILPPPAASEKRTGNRTWRASWASLWPDSNTTAQARASPARTRSAQGGGAAAPSTCAAAPPDAASMARAVPVSAAASRRSSPPARARSGHPGSSAQRGSQALRRPDCQGLSSRQRGPDVASGALVASQSIDSVSVDP